MSVLVGIEHQHLAGIEFGGPKAILAVDLPAPRARHRRRRLVFGIFDVCWDRRCRSCFAPDIEIGAALGIGIGVVDSLILRNLTKIVASTLRCWYRSWSARHSFCMNQSVAVRIQAEHVLAGRPGRELAGLRIVFDGSFTHADDDIALVIELHLVRAAAGIARAAIAAFAVAPGSFRRLEGNFRRLRRSSGRPGRERRRSDRCSRRICHSLMTSCGQTNRLSPRSM